MENLNLSAQTRDLSVKLKDIRANKLLPAVVYGHKQESIAIQLNYSEFLKTFRKSGESHFESDSHLHGRHYDSPSDFTIAAESLRNQFISLPGWANDSNSNSISDCT